MPALAAAAGPATRSDLDQLQGVWTSVAVNRDDLAAEAAIALVAGAGYSGRYEEGHLWAQQAEALLDRLRDRVLVPTVIVDEHGFAAREGLTSRAFAFAQRQLILLSVFFRKIAPVSIHVPNKKFMWLLSGSLQRSKCTWRGNDIA